MPPVEEAKYIYMKVVGGDTVVGADVSSKCDSFGMAARKVDDDIIAVSKDWKSIKVPVEVQVLNRQVTVRVLSSASFLIQRTLKKLPRVRSNDKEAHSKHEGNLEMGDIVEIPKQM